MITTNLELAKIYYWKRSGSCSRENYPGSRCAVNDYMPYIKLDTVSLKSFLMNTFTGQSSTLLLFFVKTKVV
jgi:hypothetical protein